MIKRCLTYVGICFFKIFLSLRYTVTYKGLKKLRKQLEENPRGILFLPNHPAVFVDPLLVLFPILAKFDAKPLVAEHMYFQPLFNWAMRWVQAIPVPNFSTGVNALKLARLNKALKLVSEGLSGGKAYVIYPSGMTKRTGREVLGGAFAVHDLVSTHPDVHIVLVRTTGLWGSRFSRAQSNGEIVCLSQVFKDSFFDLLKAAIFFLPRRKITIEYELAPADFPRSESKQVMNRYLEHWYNKPFEFFENSAEPYTDVAYSFFSKNTQRKEEKKEGVSVKEYQIPQEVQDDIVEKIAMIANVPQASIKPSQHLIADLNLDSLNIAELVTFLENTYAVKQIDPESLQTVGSVLLAASGKLVSQKTVQIEWNKSSWNRSRAPQRMFLGEETTIPRAFFDVSMNHLFETIAADQSSGPLTYYQLRARVLLVFHAIEKLPGRYIGILLPASIGAQILVLACQMAGKVPVMINWTVGGAHLESVVSISKLEAVITSWAFLDRLENADLRPIENMLCILEEMRASFSWIQMLTSPIKALFPTSLLKKFRLAGSMGHIAPDDEAVILFTSGTENMPKGVPLSHRNILSNMRSTLQSVDIYSTDRFLSSLPPFHSFGCTVTGLLPLLAAIRVFYSPSPTDSGVLAQTIREWGISIICSAPSFLVNLLRQGKKHPFDQVRVVVAGAEKPSAELYELLPVAAPHSLFWIGYGITECAPVLSVNSFGDKMHGVGKAIPSVRFRIVEIENYEKTCPNNTAGMILASGPNIFKGYFHTDSSNAFFEKDGIRWYVTGDLGALSDEGYLTITGRLKRFVKIGGEMVSLGALESALAKAALFPETDGPQLAICAKGESEGRPRLILYATKNIPLPQVNTILRQHGFSNLVRIDQVITLEEIPLSGTGKIAYRKLELVK